MAIKRRKSVSEIEIEMVGSEPNFNGKIMSEGDMSTSLGWYAQNRDNKSAIKYLNDYLKKNKIKVSTEVINKQPSTFCYLCRLKYNGAIFSDSHEQSFRKYYDAMIDSTKAIKSVKPATEKKKVISIQDRVQEKVNEIAGELEGSVDDYILSGYKVMPSPFAIMQNKMKGGYVNKLTEIFKKRRAEYDEVLHTKDPDLKEGYSNFTKAEVKKLIAYFDLIITDALKTSGEVKKTRKPRKRKVKTPEQLVAKLNYLPEDKTYKIKSVDPKQIIGATQLWVFNVKLRKLGVYVADDASGFTVKNSCLQNFTEMKSVAKRIRKPENILPEVIKGGKVFLRNVMGTIKAKESLLTGRINKDTILLRVS